MFLRLSFYAKSILLNLSNNKMNEQGCQISRQNIIAGYKKTNSYEEISLKVFNFWFVGLQ